jgi:predicted deacetylase
MTNSRPSRFLIRFDDVCPTINWATWAEIERSLDEYGVKPIVAIVPDNQDRALRVSPPRADFWGVVRKWQEKGWTVGMHGYQHLYTTAESGMLRLNNRSEFAGLTHAEQHTKLCNALKIFERERIAPDIWVAPAHSFDFTTVRILKQIGLAVISDGLAPFPHRDSDDVIWVPQQLWRFRRVPAGVWTICFHCNQWNKAQLTRFRLELKSYSQMISTLPEILRLYGNRRETIADRVGAAAVLGFIRTAGYCDRIRHAYSS